MFFSKDPLVEALHFPLSSVVRPIKDRLLYDIYMIREERKVTDGLSHFVDDPTKFNTFVEAFIK